MSRKYCPVFDRNFGRQEVPMEATAKQDKRCTYKRNIELHSCNNCCSRKAIIITYFVCVFVPLGIQHAMRIAPYCHLWPAPFYNIFPHFLINGTIFGKNRY